MPRENRSTACFWQWCWWYSTAKGSPPSTRTRTRYGQPMHYTYSKIFQESVVLLCAPLSPPLSTRGPDLCAAFTDSAGSWGQEECNRERNQARVPKTCVEVRKRREYYCHARLNYISISLSLDRTNRRQCACATPLSRIAIEEHLPQPCH